jgi:hypothetical protein
MSQNSKCFPSLKCMSRSKSTADKIKAPIRMPTIREFIKKNNNTGTQTSFYEGIFTKTEEIPSFSSKKPTTPTNYRSTIAVRNAGSFIPLSTSESVKSVNKITSNSSFMSQIKQPSARDNTVFMSKGSFDEIFEALKLKKQESLVESKKEDSRASRLCDPFVLTEQQKPKIIPITPLNKKHSFNCRPLIRNSLGSILSELDSESIHK